MLVGVPKEIKDNEFRVGMTPAAVAELVHHGHRSSSRPPPASARGRPTRNTSAPAPRSGRYAAEIFARAEMIVKVKEPLADERKRLRRGQILFTYLHLAPDLAADAGSDRFRRGLHRLRDRDRCARAACRC